MSVYELHSLRRSVRTSFHLTELSLTVLLAFYVKVSLPYNPWNLSILYRLDIIYFHFNVIIETDIAWDKCDLLPLSSSFSWLILQCNVKFIPLRYFKHMLSAKGTSPHPNHLMVVFDIDADFFVVGFHAYVWSRGSFPEKKTIYAVWGESGCRKWGHHVQATWLCLSRSISLSCLHVERRLSRFCYFIFSNGILLGYSISGVQF